jgi:hypothetical protein
MAVGTAVAGVGISAAKFFEGRAMQRKGQELINKFQWQELENPYETQQVSTLGADLQKEQQQISEATAVESLKASGTRGLVGGLGQVQAQSNIASRQVAAELDAKQKELNLAKAGQDIANQKLIEQRQRDEIAGYGQMMNVGMGMKQSAYGDAINAFGEFAQTEAGENVDAWVARGFKKEER